MAEKSNLFWLSDANTAHTRRWVKALSERGLKVLVFSLSEPDEDWADNLDNVSFETAGFSTGFSYAEEGSWQKLLYGKAVPRVRKLFRSFRPFLAHAHYVSSYGLLATLAGLRPRMVSAWGADVYTAPERSFLHRAAITRVLRSADSVSSTSWVMRERVLELVDREIGVVPFGVDVDRFRAAPDNNNQKNFFAVGTIKSLEAKYGIAYLLRGFALLRNRNPEIGMRLLISGSGSLLAQLQELSDQLGISDVTSFLGRIDYDIVHRRHQELDVAVYPSIEDSESFGVSVVESQACGVPVIVSQVGGLVEVVEEGVTGLVVPPKDPESIARALERLMKDPAYRTSLGSAGRERVVEYYSLEHTTDLMLSQYQRFWDH